MLFPIFRKLGSFDKDDSSVERTSYVENVFKQLKLDDVQVEESHYVVTYPGSQSRLEVLTSDGSLVRNVTINRNVRDLKGDNNSYDVGSEELVGECLATGKAKVC